MAYTVLSLDDFLDMKITPNMKSIDYLLAVSEVSYLKSMYGEETDTIAEQDKEFRIKKEEKITQNIRSILSSFPHVLDQKSSLDLVIPKKKRSMPKAHPREVTGFDNGGDSMIKKAVEHNSEEHRVVKDNWDIITAKFEGPPGVTVSDLKLLEYRAKTDDDRQNRGITIDYWSNVNKKRSREVAFSNQERFLHKEKPKKRKITARAAVVRPPVVIINRELSTGLKNQILLSGGSVESVKLVIEKTLFETDVKAAEGRFSIPQNKMNNAFLKPDEEQLLSMRNEANKMCEMNVMLIEPSYQTCEINLRKWTMNKNNGNASSSYVLVKHWNGVVRRNRLRSGMQMQLWAFRKDENLCFALVNV